MNKKKTSDKTSNKRSVKRSDNKGSDKSSDLQSALDSLKSKGVHVLLVDGKIKLRGNVDRNIKEELRILKANRETLCLLLEIESTTCDDDDDTPESDRESESVKQAKETKPDTKPTSSPSLDITPNMSQAQIEECIRQYNEKVRLEREEINAKRRDKSLVEVSPGVFRNREEVEREIQKQTNKWLYDTRGRTTISIGGRTLQSLTAFDNTFREWTESRYGKW